MAMRASVKWRSKSRRRRVSGSTSTSAPGRRESFRHVVLPMIAPSLVGIGLFGFTLSWDEVARSSQAMGSDQNTLPLELTGVPDLNSLPRSYTFRGLLRHLGSTLRRLLQ